MTIAQAWHIDDIAWQEIGADGTKYALLEGRRDTPGQPFTYAFSIPAGFWDPPHWHTADARVMVMKGALQLGYGEAHDPARLATYPVGSVVVVLANARHFDGADEDTLIVGVALGPWATHYFDASVEPSAGTIADSR